MKKPVFCPLGESAALRHASTTLRSWGYDLSAAPEEATHLLLPIPTPEAIIPCSLGVDVTVFCGNVKDAPENYIDLLQDPYYLAENAAITAHCAITLLRERTSLDDKSVLIIGWGRIGKCLADQLAKAGVRVSLAVRKESDCAMLQALGIPALLLPVEKAAGFDIIINTAPAPVLAESAAREDALLLDLASAKGIAGDRVIWARGLPGKMAPEASGALIAKTVLRYALGKE